MNRIYQGRVTSVEIPDGKDESGNPKWRKLDDWQSVLWQHHELFQDAVNYYTVCLAALASDTLSPIGKLRNQLAAVWEPFGRAGGRFKGLRDSIVPWVMSGKTTPTVQEVFEAVLGESNAEPQLLQLAVDALVEDLGGDAAIQQEGRGYLPRFCSPDYNGQFPRGAISLQKQEAKTKLPAMLHESAAVQNLDALAGKLEFGFFANPIPNAKPLAGQEARDKLLQALTWLKIKNPGLTESAEHLESKIRLLPDSVSFPSYAGGSINKDALKHRFFAYLLFQYVERSLVTFGTLRDSFPVPKTPARTSANTTSDTTVRLTRFGDDPIKLARGHRGFVFRAFTSLPCWGAKEPRDILWSEFDIAAFKEALKTVNQFELKTEERLERAREFSGRLAWMNGDKSMFKPSEHSEQEPPAVLQGDPRFDVVKKLFEVELAEEHYLAGGESVTYGLYPRTLRGYRELAERWNKRVKPDEMFSDKVFESLVSATNKFQSENKDRIGSVTLFRKLLEKNYWCLWQAPDEATVAARQKAGFSSNIIEDYQYYLELQADITRLKEPIRFTPADAEHSRRLFMFSDLAGKSRHEHQPNATADGFSVDVSLALRKEGVWRETRVRLHYSAPRLRRDGLRKGTEEDLKRTAWLQPMAAALNLPEPASQDFTKCAVSLMPDRSWNGLRCLLNFPVTLDPSAMQRAIGTQVRWNNQFVAFGKGATEQKFFLCWPEEVSASQKKAGPWWDALSSFSCLAVDLGQRDAGAFALLDARTSDTSEKKPSRPIGETEGKHWRATLAAAGLLRLPGEDALVWRGGEWQEELYGEKGRLASAGEWKETVSILASLGQKPEDWIGVAPSHWSFPELNTKLLVAARREQSWLARLHRWLWMLSDEDKRENALAELMEQERVEAWRQSAKTKDIAALKKSLEKEIQRLNGLLPEHLVIIANRCLPLRRRKWAWNPHPERELALKGCHVLEMVDAPGRMPLLAGQKGIPFERIEQLEELRRRFQSLNRVMQRELGAQPKSGRELRNDPVPDCCPDILDKLDRVKEQRVNQTAHLIVAQALGVRLRAHQTPESDREERNVHGEYEIIPGRKPVDFIVLEDLSRYLSSQGRAPNENSRLMKWCHRQVTAKVKELSEPFGLPVLETPAAYSSKFCSRTGAAGFRAMELTLDHRHSFPWSKKLEEHGVEVTELFEWLEKANASRRTKPSRCLLAPISMGPLFVPVMSHAPIMQADINAAINLGLRAVAAPKAHEIHLRIRSEAKDGRFRVRTGSRREKARWGNQPPEIKMFAESERAALAREGRNPNFFVDLAKAATFDNAEVEGLALPVASGRGLWRSVRNAEWKRCREINLERMCQCGLQNKELPKRRASEEDSEDNLIF